MILLAGEVRENSWFYTWCLSPPLDLAICQADKSTGERYPAAVQPEKFFSGLVYIAVEKSIWNTSQLGNSDPEKGEHEEMFQPFHVWTACK